MLQQLSTDILTAAHDQSRYLVAVAGPPASGKSTLAQQLKHSLNQQAGSAISAVVPMDGFHLDNATLDTKGLRQRKGAPETFDADGFVTLIRHLRMAQDTIMIPLFDRTQDAVIPDAKAVTMQQQILLIEGNYLLLEQQPWAQLHALFDDSIFLNPGLDILEQRLVQRWLDHGYDQAGATQRALSNDIPNARFVVKHSLSAQHMITQQP